MKNGIKTSRQALRKAIASNLSNLSLVMAASKSGEYVKMVQVESEAPNVDKDYSSDKVVIAVMLRELAVASTVEAPKNKIINDTTAGKVLEGIGGLIKKIASPPFDVPIGLLAALIPIAKAERRDGSGFALDCSLPFGADEMPDDRRKPNRNDITGVEVTLKYTGGFCCSDDDGDSFLNIAATLVAGSEPPLTSNVKVWGELEHDPAAPGKAQGEAGRLYYSGSVNLNAPNGGKVEEDKTYRFHDEMKVTANNPGDDLLLIINFGVTVGSESDTTIIFSSDNATSAWIDPFELTLRPIHS